MCWLVANDTTHLWTIETYRCLLISFIDVSESHISSNTSNALMVSCTHLLPTVINRPRRNLLTFSFSLTLSAQICGGNLRNVFKESRNLNNQIWPNCQPQYFIAYLKQNFMEIHIFSFWQISSEFVLIRSFLVVGLHASFFSENHTFSCDSLRMNSPNFSTRSVGIFAIFTISIVCWCPDFCVRTEMCVDNSAYRGVRTTRA